MWPFTSRTEKEQRILTALDGGAERSSYELGKITGLGSGALYPTLYRMEHAGTLASRWGIATAERGWHRPRLYRINH